MKNYLTVGIVSSFILNSGVALSAINPIDVSLTPTNGLPAITRVGNFYEASYTFTNNLPFSELLQVSATTIGSGFTFDNLCNKVTLAPKGQVGSTCTTKIKFQPINIGSAKAELTLAYDKNVIHLRPPAINNLSTTVALCGNEVFPSNTGAVVPAPIINSPQVWSFVSAPELHPMKVNINLNNLPSNEPGLIFNAPYTSSSESMYGQTGSLIADNDGNPIWFRPLSSPSLMNTDFRVQTLNNASVLTFWQGTVATAPAYTNIPTGAAEPGACYYILDNSYNVIYTISAFNGFTADVHEFLLTPNNTALFFATKVVPMDLTPYGGPANGAIHDFSIQEVDLATSQLIFFWDAKDHIPLTSSNIPANTAPQTNNIWDVYHLNSLGLISGSDDILFSSRNTWTIYRLNKSTGNFVWRLVSGGNGAPGDFTVIGSDAQFSWQHDARYLPGDVISMFDDACCENYSTVPPGTIPSHGLKLQLDLIAKTATFQRSYYHSPNLFSSSQGNTQSLGNGNIFVGYGANGYYSEFAEPGNTVLTPTINLLYDAQMPGSNVSYRSYRVNWVGKPIYPPSITVESINHQTVVYASWNGSTETTSWQLYAGLHSNDLQLVSTTGKTGFETAILSSNNGPFFQVKAKDASNQVIGTSNIIFYQTTIK